jgi:hypothetical protein
MASLLCFHFQFPCLFVLTQQTTPQHTTPHHTTTHHTTTHHNTPQHTTTHRTHYDPKFVDTFPLLNKQHAQERSHYMPIPGQVPIIADAGSAIIFDIRVLHRGMANHTKQVRYQ